MKALLVALLLAQDHSRKFEEAVKAAAERGMKAFVFVGGGSGALISEDGYFLTNHHVAGDARDSVSVILHDGKRYAAKKVATDPVGDLSLFKIDDPGRRFDYLPLGDSDALEPGEYVIAVGNPFNLGTLASGEKHYPSVSLGVVSAVHRYQGTYYDAIQTDAALNPGNSGGPLITLEGRLVGINGRIATRFGNRVNSGVGFAISSAQIRRFLDVMKAGGDRGVVYHGEIKGLELAPEFTQGAGAKVQRVAVGSVAERSGFKAGDVIKQVEQYRVHSRERFLGVVGTFPAGSKLKVVVQRGVQELTLEAKLDRFQEREATASGNTPQRPRGTGYLGVRLEDKEEGLTVVEVLPGTPAENAGMQAGDVITEMDGKPVKLRADFLQRLWKKKPGDRIRLTVSREGSQKEFQIELAKHPDD